QVQVLEHDGTDQGGFAFRLDDSLEGAVATQQFNVSVFRLTAPSPATIGVTDPDRITQAQAQLLNDSLGQHQLGCPPIHHTPDGLPAHLVGRKLAAPRHFQVAEVGDLEFDGNSPHAVGSVAGHGTAPFDVAMPEKAS